MVESQFKKSHLKEYCERSEHPILFFGLSKVKLGERVPANATFSVEFPTVKFYDFVQTTNSKSQVFC